MAPQDSESGYGRLFQGDETGWTAGVQFSSTVGRRLARTRVQNLQLQVAKATGVLNEQMAEINLELADAIREIDSNRKQMALNRKRVLSHERNRSASAARFDAVGDPSEPTDVASRRAVFNEQPSSAAGEFGRVQRCAGEPPVSYGEACYS